MTSLGPGDHTRVRRLPEKATYDADTIFAIIDAAPFVQISAVVGDLAMSLPTLAGRDGHTLYVHGSPSNAILRAALGAGRVHLTATCYDGIRLARSAFERRHSCRRQLRPVVSTDGPKLHKNGRL